MTTADSSVSLASTEAAFAELASAALASEQATTGGTSGAKKRLI